MGDGRLLTDVPAAEALRLLASVSLGRIVFTQQAMPAIRPVNHIVEDGAVIIRSQAGSVIVSAARAAAGAVVAYEADAIDPANHLGWSVTITGLAHLVTEPAELARYQALLRPWVAGEMDHVIRICPQFVTGFRLTAGGGASGEAGPGPG